MNLPLLVLLMALSAFAQKEFTASFTMTSTSMGTGQVSGVFYYSWSTAAMRIQFTNQKYNETYLYDLNTHSSAGASAFNTGVCNCEIAPISAPQPVFDAVDPQWRKATAVDSTGCFKYDRITTGTDPAYSVWFNSNRQVCQAFFSDTGRTFVFSRINSAITFTRAQDFPTPSGCICKTPLDIIVVLDRSGSVDTTEWISEKKFAIDFSLSFEYPTSSADSALKTNLGVVNFNTRATTLFTLATGSSLNNVNTSLQAMTCCADRWGSSCCNGFTSISSGIRAATDELRKSTRTSNKAIVLITDGFHNTLFSPSRQCYSCSSNIPDATQAMLDCVTNSANAQGRKDCLTDLTDAAKYAYQNVNGLKIFTVAVGAIFSKPLEEFNILTRYDSTAQFNSADFTSLSNVLKSLTQSVCGATKSACDGCCGFCACGVCNVPDTCLAPPCVNASIQGSCCRQTPFVCPNTNPCQIVNCVANGANSVCQSTPYPCPASTGCYSYNCVNGRCIQNFLGVPANPCKIAVCENNQIVQKDVCTPGTDKCIDYGCSNGICTAIPKSFANCFECDPLTGNPKAKVCSPINCFDNKCNVATGNCEAIPISCISNPADKCDTSYCNPATGSCVQRNTNSLCVNSTNKCTYTPGCDSTTGNCIYKDVTCPLSTNCQDNICNQTNGLCELVNTSRCSIICANQDCSTQSTACITKICDPDQTSANCLITTYKNQSCIDAIKGDTCKTFDNCNDTTGCVYKIEKCTTPPTNSCQYYVADSSYLNANGTCCKLMDKVCGYDKCLNYICNATNGVCTSTPVCPASDACTIWTCNPTTGSCSFKNTTCTVPNKCSNFVRCDSKLGCIFTPKNCNDNKNCTTDTCDLQTGNCNNKPIQCDDSSECTIDSCDEISGGKCQFKPKDCNDNDACTIDTCNKTIKGGCVNTKVNATSYCDDSNACTIDTCDKKLGCVRTNRTCNDKEPCTLDRCDRFHGCLFNPVVCNVTVPCAIGFCSNKTGNCTLTPLICNSNLELIVATSVSGGILAAIICAAIIGAALFGGGSVALYNQVSNAANTMSVSNNPLYSAPAPGNNPLYTPA